MCMYYKYRSMRVILDLYFVMLVLVLGVGCVGSDSMAMPESLDSRLRPDTRHVTSKSKYKKYRK